MVENFTAHITPFELDRNTFVYCPMTGSRPAGANPLCTCLTGTTCFLTLPLRTSHLLGPEGIHGQPPAGHHRAPECNHEGNAGLRSTALRLCVAGIRYKGPRQGVSGLVVQELKPLIGRKYPTLPDRENTAIGGSSMGGLMSHVRRSRRITRRSAARLPVAVGAVQLYRGEGRHQKAKLAPGTRVYISWGEREGKGRHALAQYTGKALEVTNLLTAGGARRSTLLPAGRQALRGRLAASAGALLYISVRMEVSRGQAKQKQKEKAPRPQAPAAKPAQTAPAPEQPPAQD